MIQELMIANNAINPWPALNMQTRYHHRADERNSRMAATAFKVVAVVSALPLVAVATGLIVWTGAVAILTASAVLFVALAILFDRMAHHSNLLANQAPPSVSAVNPDLFFPEEVSVGASLEDLNHLLLNPNLGTLQRLRISSLHLNNEMLGQLATRCPQLQVIELKDCVNITDVGVQALVRHCQQLRGLSLDGCSKLTEKTMQNIRLHTTDLRRLNISNCIRINWWQPSEQEMRHSLFLPKLQVLEMNNCPQLARPETLKWVASLPYLAHFKMDNAFPDERSLNDFFQIAASLSELKLTCRADRTSLPELEYFPRLTSLSTDFHLNRHCFNARQWAHLQAIVDLHKGQGHWKLEDVTALLVHCPNLRKFEGKLERQEQSQDAVVQLLATKGAQFTDIALQGNFTNEALRILATCNDKDKDKVFLFPNLQTLTLKGIQASKANINALLQLPQLRKLHLICHPYRGGITLDVEAAARCDLLWLQGIELFPLEFLHILHLRQVPMDLIFDQSLNFIEHLADIIREDAKFRAALRMSLHEQLTISENNLANVQAIVEASTNLRELEIDLEAGIPEPSQKLIALLERCPQITRLAVDWNGTILTQEHLVRIATICPRLTHLELTGNGPPIAVPFDKFEALHTYKTNRSA